MTVQEAADYLGISPQRVRKLISQKRLHAVKHGRDWWVSEHAAMAFLEKPRINGRPRKA